MRVSFLLFLMLWPCKLPTLAQQSAQTVFVGCVNRRPDGTLQLGLVPSGRLYQLQGRTKLLEEHVNQIVRVFGQAQTGGANDQPPLLTVNGVQGIAGTCSATLPAKKRESAEGKVGEDAIAVPIATTATAEETTAGFQTESGLAQSPGEKNVPAKQLRHSARSPYAPGEPDQVAQSEAAANVNALAATRTEILPGNTLGVSSSPGPPPAANRAAVIQGGVRAIPVDIRGDETLQLSPARLTIRIGQTVQWRNSSPRIHEIIANPARAKDAANALLPAGVKPFDSGLLRPDATFTYRFTVPGVYRYFCDLNSPQQVVGEIMVGR